jgi:putative membrane protein
LEVGPGLAGIIVLITLHKRFPMSHMVYVCVFLHIFILIYRGYCTCAETPLGNWARDAFGFSRNHDDSIGHIALGVFPAFIIREVQPILSGVHDRSMDQLPGEY